MIQNASFISPSIGKKKRLNNLFFNEKCVFVPLDDSLISGPFDGLFDLRKKIEEICNAKPSAILGFPGTVKLLNDRFLDIPFILNLTASTTLYEHTKKEVISTVEQAISLGADAVAVHINFSSKYESNMLKSLGDISETCCKYGIPLMVLAYPRKEKIDNGKYIDENYIDLKLTSPDKYTKLVAHCVRVAYELGADIIKTQYTGSIESFQKVVIAAQGTPLVIAGGPLLEERELFGICRNAIDAGAAGVCLGRNVFNRCNSINIIESIKKIVFNGISVEDAINYIKYTERGIDYEQQLQ